MTSEHLQYKQDAIEKDADQPSYQSSRINVWNRISSKNIKAILQYWGGNILHHNAMSLILHFYFKVKLE